MDGLDHTIPPPPHLLESQKNLNMDWILGALQELLILLGFDNIIHNMIL